MARFIIWGILALVVIRLLSGLFRGVLQGMGHRSGGAGNSVGLVRDPVCGMFVSPQTALTSGTGSEARFFCSEKCRQDYARHA